jgi:predicted membrane protein
MTMPLLNVVVTLVIIGVVLWLINTYIPMQSTIKTILNIVVVIAVVVWLLYGYGLISHGAGVTVVHTP